MSDLCVPDLCARLDRLKMLCDRLEATQHDRRKYHELIDVIRAEADAFRHVVCAAQPETPRAGAA